MSSAITKKFEHIINSNSNKSNKSYESNKCKINPYIKFRKHSNKTKSHLNCNKNEEIGFGIDLGTTNSVISAVIKNEPQIIKTEENGSVVPSVVCFLENGKIIVGSEAKRVMTNHPNSCFYSIKRFIGKRYNDVKEDIKNVPFKVLSDEENKVCFEHPYNKNDRLYPQDISAYTLRYLLDLAQNRFKINNIQKCVISVPAYFDLSQRAATIEAGKIAGLEKIRLIKEPVASALGYGISIKEEKTVLVFDLGGGTFDVSILEVGNGCIEVLATGGDSHLGGDDFDARIISKIKKKLMSKNYNIKNDAQIKTNLKALAEYSKMKLSYGNEIILNVPVLGSKEKIKVSLHRKEIESVCKDLYSRARQAVDKCCFQAGVILTELLDELKNSKLNEEIKIRPKSRSVVTEVLLVGGSTKMPSIKAFVENMTGLDPLMSVVDPDKAVAIGAAIQADILSSTGNDKNLILMDVWQASLLRALADDSLNSGNVNLEI